MSAIIPVKYAVYDKNRFSKVIDIQFKELYTTEPIAPEVTVADFFALYDSLFFSISKEGDIDSHRYILNREAEYLGVKFADNIDINALLQEITDLRKQLVNTEATNIQLSSQLPANSGSSALNTLSALTN